MNFFALNLVVGISAGCKHSHSREGGSVVALKVWFEVSIIQQRQSSASVFLAYDVLGSIRMTRRIQAYQQEGGNALLAPK